MSIPIPTMPPIATAAPALTASQVPDMTMTPEDQIAANAAKAAQRLAEVSAEAAAPAAPAAPATIIPAAPTVQSIPAAPTVQSIPAAPTVQSIPAAPATIIPAAPAAQGIPEAPVSQEMVPVAPQEMAQARPQENQLSIAAIAEQMGFSGINFDAFGVVPNVSLNQGEFRLSSGEILGTEFLCHISTSRNKFLYTYDLPDSDSRKRVCYSFDKVTSANGNKTLQEFRQEAALLGCGVIEKLYHEVAVTLEDGRPVNLSVPDAGSGASLASYIVKCVASGVRPSEVMTRVKKGPRVESVKNPFTPWAFEIVE